MFSTWLGKIRSFMGKPDDNHPEEGYNIDGVNEEGTNIDLVTERWQLLDTGVDGGGSSEVQLTPDMGDIPGGSAPYNPRLDTMEIQSHPFLTSNGSSGGESMQDNTDIQAHEASGKASGDISGGIQSHMLLAGEGDTGGDKIENTPVSKTSNTSVTDTKSNTAIADTKSMPGDGHKDIASHPFLTGAANLGVRKADPSVTPQTKDSVVKDAKTSGGGDVDIQSHADLAGGATSGGDKIENTPVSKTSNTPVTDTKSNTAIADTKSMPGDGHKDIASHPFLTGAANLVGAGDSNTETQTVVTGETGDTLAHTSPIPEMQELSLEAGNKDKPNAPAKLIGDDIAEATALVDTEAPVGKGDKEEKVGDDVAVNATGSQADKSQKSRDKKKKKKAKRVNVCKYIQNGADCWYGDKCKFSHDVSSVQSSSRDAKVADAKVASADAKVASTSSPDKTQEAKPSPGPVPEAPKGPEGYVPYVLQMTAAQRQVGAKDLFYQLGFQAGVAKTETEKAVIGQYKLAAARQNTVWIREARYYAEILFPGYWIDENIPGLDQRSQRKNKPSKSKTLADKQNEVFEAPSGLCRDFRLKDNPELQVVHAEIAGAGSGQAEPATKQPDTVPAVDASQEVCQASDDGRPLDAFVSDYTSSLIDSAVKLAISEGLSESAIMEVIDDVTADTPRRKMKPTPVDTSRTPRKQPDQLAIGFNYHSDLVIKDSPKTFRGGIIPIDESKTPRERVEKLAVGFNYHSDTIAKDSPKLANEDVTGSSGTPRHRSRDQLAIGFNYHSDLIVKASPQIKEDTSKPTDVEMNGVADISPEENNNFARVETPKSTKKFKTDTIAVGFSYNSDQIMKQSLNEMNVDVTTEVACLSEEAKEAEGRNCDEMTDESLPVGNLPAGSLW